MNAEMSTEKKVYAVIPKTKGSNERMNEEWSKKIDAAGVYVRISYKVDGRQ
jgi:O-phosphoseryl-tRNA(Cys) synthetase